MDIIKDSQLGTFVIYDREFASGGFGSIHKAIHCESNTPVAIKESSYGDTEEIIKEFNYLKTLTQKCKEYVLCLYGLINRTGVAYMIMEYIYGGINLANYINYKIPLSSNDRYIGRKNRDDVAVQLIRALNYMHTIGIAHQDIKESNIMWDFQGDLPRFIDFGSAVKKGMLPETGFIGYTGTYHTSAPEFKDAVKRGEANISPGDIEKLWGVYSNNTVWKTAVAHDIWSIGIVLLNWYCFDRIDGDSRFYDLSANEIFDLINTRIPPEENPFANNILHLLLQVDPKKRIDNWTKVLPLVDNKAVLNWRPTDLNSINYNQIYERDLIAPAMLDPKVEDGKKICQTFGLVPKQLEYLVPQVAPKKSPKYRKYAKWIDDTQKSLMPSGNILAIKNVLNNYTAAQLEPLIKKHNLQILPKSDALWHLAIIIAKM